jgi:D-serine deaminase-like pyridoxal phosphate-dependent protein
MGYEGHLMMVDQPTDKVAETERAMALLLAASADVGGDLVSAGGTGTFDVNTWATEIQAGSYLLMDTRYAQEGVPFELALTVLGTVVSSSSEWCVVDVGLKSLSLDHGNPSIDGSLVWFCSDEHTTSSPPRAVGERVRVLPSHVDPTMALHEVVHLVDGESVVETWPVDLRGW